MATVKLTIDTRSVKKDGTHPVKLYVSHQGDDFFISTNISVKIEDWSGKDGQPTKLRNINSILTQMLVQAQAHIYKLRAEGKLASINKIQLRKILSSNSFEEDNSPRQSSELLKNYFELFLSRKDKSSTISTYQLTLLKIGKYFDLSQLKFSDINYTWLLDYEQKLKSEKLAINTISIHFRNLRAIFNSAIDEEVIDQNTYPFRRFKIKSEKTAKRSLTVEQLRTLRDYPCEPHQEKYRDTFMLIFYLIGINIIDLCHLTEIVDGKVEYRRAKTGTLYSIKVPKEAQVIIDKYRGEKHLLNILDNYQDYKNFAKKVNNNLREIGQMKRSGLGGKKHRTPIFPEITTYWARHTWATIAASLDIPKETIAAALGHGGNTVTDVYINFDQRKVDEANRRVIDYLFREEGFSQ